MFKTSFRPWQPAAVIAVLVLLTGCNREGAGGAPETGPVAVQAVSVQPQVLALTSELPGRIEPLRVAEVRARVAGIVLKRNFEEGASVEAGQVLFQIDPAPFVAALDRAEAALFEANATVRRYQPLVKIGAVSQQEFDTARATLKTATANVKTAKLELDYATVRAPISGRIGRALVTEGALVGQNETTPLATIQQIDRVYADFRQPVADALRLREALQSGRLTQDAEQGAPISVTVEGTNRTRDGRLLFSDITVDRGTSQVLLRGQFPNEDGLLLPGMYVRVHVGQGTDPRAILVPQRAVLRSIDGQAQVMVVGKDDVVEARSVRTGVMRGADWQIVEGLQPGDRVIVGGAATPGATVTVAEPASSESRG